MGKLLNDATMGAIKTNSNYQFSAVKMDKLGASAYTLVTIVADTSSSLSGFDRDLEKMIKEVVNSCKKSPRSDNLMLRLVTFATREKEEHGFKLLNNINDVDYDNIIQTQGCTLLFDSSYNSIEATADYAKSLTDQDYDVNAIVFIITDGENTDSKYTPSSISDLVLNIKKSEALESISTVLIGMNSSPRIQKYLDDFKTNANIDHFIDMGDVTASKLAKLSGFISKSITSTSQALGTGGPSQSLTF